MEMFVQYGLKSLDQLIGMFAFAIYNKKTKELVKWGQGNEAGAVSADRNRMIQLVVGEYRDKRCPVHGIENDWYEYYGDWNSWHIADKHPRPSICWHTHDWRDQHDDHLTCRRCRGGSR